MFSACLEKKRIRFLLLLYILLISEVIVDSALFLNTNISPNTYSYKDIEMEDIVTMTNLAFLFHIAMVRDLYDNSPLRILLQISFHNKTFFDILQENVLSRNNTFFQKVLLSIIVLNSLFTHVNLRISWILQNKTIEDIISKGISDV